MAENYEVIEFQKVYFRLNSRFKKADEELFNLGLIVAYESELNKGFIVKKQLKTTNKGTKFYYKKIETEEELNNYINEVKLMIKKLNLERIVEQFKAKTKNIELECV